MMYIHLTISAFLIELGLKVSIKNADIRNHQIMLEIILKT
jgi:hypothetical protein